MSRSLLTVLLFLATRPLCADDHPLDWIPADSGVVVRLKNPQAATGKLAALADRVQENAGAAIRGNTPVLGLAISNPALTGVDQERDWYVFARFRADGPPVVVFAVPATDAEAFQKALPPAFESAARESADKKTWLLYSEDAGAIESLSREGAGDDESILARMDERSRAAFDAGDISAFVNVNELTDVYRWQIDQGRAAVHALVDQMENLLSQQPSSPFNAEELAGIYRTLVGGLSQALEDANSLTVTIHLDEQALRVVEFIDFEEGSASAQVFDNQQGSPQPLLSRLIPGAVMYYGFSGNVDALQKWGLAFSASLTASDEGGKKLTELLEGFKDVHFGEIAASVDLAESLEGGVLRTTTIVEAEPIAALQTLMRQLSAATAGISVEGLTQETRVEADAETYGEHKADVVTITQEWSEELDPLGFQKQMQEVFFGGEGMQSRIVYLKDRYIQTMGGGRELAEQALDAAAAEGANDVAPWRADIAAAPNLLFLLDLPGLGVKGIKVARQFPELPLSVSDEQLAALQQEPSYLAFALTAEPHALRCETRLPATQIAGVLKLVQFARQLHGER